MGLSGFVRTGFMKFQGYSGFIGNGLLGFQ